MRLLTSLTFIRGQQDREPCPPCDWTPGSEWSREGANLPWGLKAGLWHQNSGLVTPAAPGHMQLAWPACPVGHSSCSANTCIIHEMGTWTTSDQKGTHTSARVFASFSSDSPEPLLSEMSPWEVTDYLEDRTNHNQTWS